MKVVNICNLIGWEKYNNDIITLNIKLFDKKQWQGMISVPGKNRKLLIKNEFIINYQLKIIYTYN